MTVDAYFTQETDAFVLKNAKFYPEKIPITHWQLRHFISSPEPSTLFYASSRDIFALDTNSGVRTHITCLPFWARCTAAGYGYICVGGGDSGHFAVVTLNHTHGLSREALGWQPSRPPTVQVEQAGQEIVNSISIHKLQGDDETGTLDDVVAVITNNDKTIRVFSLTQHSQNTVLELPFSVNHATISPDGRTLVAVGDYQQAYFYERVDLSSSNDRKPNRYASAHCMWELLNIVSLHVPRTITATGYFTTAWSPSGNLCAVASECGYVSVIDMAALHEYEDAEDAIVVVVPSTRPENIHPNGAIPGAIRTMIFAPPPWDLLIWAEDQGKVCLADLRSGLKWRQILKLEPDHEGYRRVDMEINATETYRRNDPEMEREYVRNFRTYRTMAEDAGEASFDIDHELAIAETRTLAEGRSAARAALRLADDTQLSRRERELLDSLRITSQNEERGNAGSPMPRSIQYSDLADESRRSTAQQSALFTQDFPALARQNDEAGVGTSSSLPNTMRVLREYMRERGAEYSQVPRNLRPIPSAREQDLDDALAATATTTSAEPQAPTLSDRATLYQGDISRSSATRLLNTLRAAPHTPTTAPTPPLRTDSPSTITRNRDTDTPDPASDARRRRALLRARDRAAANINSSTTNAPTDRASQILLDQQRQIVLEQQQARYHARMGFAPGGVAGNLVTRGDYYDPALGLRTAGLAMSSDGRRLWAACDKGIFEFEVNVRERMSWMGVEWK